jgi:hypothetical protein
MYRKFIADKLHRIENAIKGALGNLEIMKRLSNYGYTEERINRGKVMLENVNHLMTNQVKEYGQQYAATDEQEKFLVSTYAQYMVAVKISRVAFKKQRDMLTSLGVIGQRARSLSGWLRDARILYTNLLEIPEALQTMQAYGYTAERLDRELQDVEKVENLHINQLSEKSAAQLSTQERDKAFDELCDWFSDFRAVARVALHDDLQLLEAMGISKK